jgi:hypothetical protein
MTTSRTFRLPALGLGVAGVLFLLYPLVRPYRDEATQTGAVAAMGSAAWVAAHLFAMVGFVLLGLGLLAVWRALARTPGEPLALAAVVAGWVGAGLTLPYYGAEDFALHALARKAAGGAAIDLPDVADAIRFGGAAATTFALGLLALAAAGVLAALAVWRSQLLPRASGVLFGLGLVLFIPQFFAAPWVRITHGVLLAAGCLVLAIALGRAGTAAVAEPQLAGRR